MPRSFRRGPLSSFKAFVKPSNLILMIVNISAFVIVSVLWFWYIGSQQLFVFLDQKAHVFNNIARNDENFNKLVEDMIQSAKNDTANIEKVKQDIKNRNNRNVDLFRELIAPPLTILGCLFILSIGYFFFRCDTWGWSETILVFLLLFAFLTEIIFFFVIIQDFQFMSNTTILSKLVDTTINKNSEKT